MERSDRGRRSSRQVKLKDACDICSASKVRCTREKPTCARCQKFGLPCYYSPARRIGRPHRPHPSTSQPAAPWSPPTPQDPEDAAACHPGYLPAPVSSDPQPSPNAGSAVCGGRDAASRDPQDRHSRGTNAPPAAGEPSPTCGSVILDILRDLTVRQQDLAGSKEAVSHRLASSVQQLSRILICPCSQRLDIALLTAAVCNAVLDFVDTFIHAGPPPPFSSSPPASSPRSVLGVADGGGVLSSAGRVTLIIGELHHVANLIVQLTRRYGGSAEAFGADAVDDEVRDAMPGLAEELKTRLQSTMEEATSPAVMSSQSERLNVRDFG